LQFLGEGVPEIRPFPRRIPLWNSNLKNSEIFSDFPWPFHPFFILGSMEKLHGLHGRQENRPEAAGHRAD